MIGLLIVEEAQKIDKRVVVVEEKVSPLLAVDFIKRGGGELGFFFLLLTSGGGQKLCSSSWSWRRLLLDLLVISCLL